MNKISLIYFKLIVSRMSVRTTSIDTNHYSWILVTILTNVLVANTALPQVPGLYIDHFQMGTANQTDSTLKYHNRPAGYYHSITWRDPIATTVTSSAMALNQFQSDVPQKVLTFIAEILSTNSSGALIHLIINIPDARLLTISFSIIAITNPIAEIQLIQIEKDNSMVISNSQLFVANSSKFIFNTDNPYTNVFLQWITGSGTVQTNSRYWYNFGNGNLIASGSTLKINIHSEDVFYYTNVKINFLIVARQVMNYSIASYTFVQTYKATIPSDFILNFGVDTTMYGKPITGGRCYFGLMILGTWRSNQRIQILMVKNGSDILGFTQNKIRSRTINTTCFSACPLNSFFNQPNCLLCSDFMSKCVRCQSATLCYECQTGSIVGSEANSCPLCSQIIKYCLTCSTALHCINCSSVALLSPNQDVCLLCSSYIHDCKSCSSLTICTWCYIGYPIIGGCSSVIGCVEATQIYSSSQITSLCSKCDSSQFNSIPTVNSTCQCTSGNLVGLYCTDVAGCVSTAKVNGTIKCIFCNISLLFYFDPASDTCLCQRGYEIVAGGCKNICGDGLIFSSQCDDGNTADGDGCSSVCQVEVNYHCQTNSSSNMSACRYVGLHLTATLVETRRSQGAANQGLFSFELSPVMRLLDRYDYAALFSFHCATADYQVVKWDHLDGRVSLVVDYLTDLEVQAVTVTFAFDQNFIRFVPLVLDFTVASEDLPLVFQEDSSLTVALKYLSLSAAGLSLLLLLVGSWFSKMVGVEMVNTLQIIYYLQFTITDYSQAFQNLRELSLVGLSNLFLQSESLNILLAQPYQQFSYSLALNQLTLMGITAVLSLIYTLLLILYVCSQRYNQIKIIDKVSLYCSQSLLFPLTMLILFPLFFSIICFAGYQGQDSILPISIRALMLVVSLALMSFGIFREVLTGFISDKQKSSMGKQQVREQYYLVYLLFTVSELVTLVIWLKGGQQQTSYGLLLLSVVFFCWCVCARPYKNTFGNVSICLNGALLVSFQAYLLIRKLGLAQLSLEYEIFVNLVFAASTIVCSMCGLVRVIRVIVYKVSKKIDTKEQNIEAVPKKGLTTAGSINEGTQFRGQFNTHYFQATQQRRSLLRQRVQQIQPKKAENKELQLLKKRIRQQFRKKKINEGQKVRDEGQVYNNQF